MSRAEGQGAQRTCAACRESGARTDLVRLVLGPGGELVVDYRGRLPGRGAWIHPRRACIERVMARPRMLERGLGRVPDTAGLDDHLRELVIRALLDGLSMAAASGALVGGRDLLERALREERVVHVMVASDAAARTVAGLREAAPEAVPFTTVTLDREALGLRIGRGARAAVGVTRSRAAAHLLRQLRRLQLLG